jgi:hypothetical protein
VFKKTWVAFVIATCPSTDTSTVLDINGRYLIAAESGMITPLAYREAVRKSTQMRVIMFFICGICINIQIFQEIINTPWF